MSTQTTTDAVRAARIADQAIAEADALLAINYRDETWTFAINEMSDEVNTRFCDAIDIFRSIGQRIREELPE